jgi:hypothetical protein
MVFTPLTTTILQLYQEFSNGQLPVQDTKSLRLLEESMIETA